MRIHVPRQQDREPAAGRSIEHKLRGPTVRVALMMLTAFALGVLAHKSGLVERVLHPLPDIRRTLTRTAALAHRPDHITIDIKHRDIQQLVAKRQQAIDTGILVTSPEDFVPATIRHGEEMIPVRLRLKGDLREHCLEVCAN